MSKSLFNKSILGGICIGIAGIVFLKLQIPLAGSLLFSFGLLTIVINDFKLYTGAIGYLASKEHMSLSYLIKCVVILVGNFIGTAIITYLISLTKIQSNILPYCQSIVNQKLADTSLSIFVLSVLCGMLMYLAVNTFKNENIGWIVRTLELMFCIMVFILSGFEHCIANMVYFNICNNWSLHTIMTLGIMILGNAIGGMLIPITNILSDH